MSLTVFESAQTTGTLRGPHGTLTGALTGAKSSLGCIWELLHFAQGTGVAGRMPRGKRRRVCESSDEFSSAGESCSGVYGAAYALGGASGDRSGPQCSAHPDDFCFFCAYEKDPNAESGSAADLYGSLVDLVHSMQRQRKEFPAIVDAVSVAYEAQIRAHVHDPKFGAEPDWSVASIERHLTYSSQFEAVFDGAVTQVFHALIDRQNRGVLDGVTGEVIEERRSALMNTLDHYMKWQRFQTREPRGKRSK